MPYDPNANWTARTNAAAKEPTYYVVFDGLTTVHYSTAPVRNAAVTKKLLLNVPDQIGQRLSQLQGRQTIASMSFELVDRDGLITDLVSTEKPSPILSTLMNRKVTLYAGYADLDESDYAIIGEYQVSDVSLSNQGTTYKFSCRGIKRHQFEDIFTNAEASGTVPVNTKLSADANAGANSFTLLDVANISEGDKLFLGPSTDSVDAGDEEKVTVASVVGSTVTIGSFVSGQPATLQSSYDSGDPVRWASTIIDGHPINLIYAIQTGDFANGTFPLLQADGLPTGLGIAASDIDTAALIRERDQMMGGDVWRFEIKNATAGFRFLESRFYKLLGYPFTTADGKYSLRLYRPPFAEDAAAGLPEILEKDIRSWEWRRAQKLHVNKVSLGVDMDAETGKPTNTVVSEDTADQTDTGEIAEFEELDTGFRAALSGARLAEGGGAVLLRRFVKPPMQLVIDTGLRKRALQIGEVPKLTHSKIPDVKAGTRGLSEKRMEIVEKSEELSKDNIRFILQDAAFVRPAVWAPDSFTFDYDAATEAQKEYAAWAPDAGNFADGGSPYEWV